MIRLSILSVITGVVGGLSAIVFRQMISLVFFLFFVFPMQLLGIPFPLLLIISPTLGGLIVGIMATKISVEARGHGIPEVINTVATKKGDFKLKVPVAKLIASSVTIGTGGAAGREGPIALISGGFGSTLGQKLHLTTEEKRDLIIAGVAAGISATFNAPIGGILFSIEVIRRDNKASPIIPLIISSVIGAGIGIIFLGQAPSFDFPTESKYAINTINVVSFIILGLIAGLVSLIWIKAFYLIEDSFEAIKISNVLKTTIGGLLTGLIQLLLWLYGLPLFFWLNLSPDLGTDSIETINLAFSSKITLEIALVLAIIGIIITSFTLGSGGSGGIFAPTLFLGVMVGSVVGLIFSLFPEAISLPSVALLAVLGMASVFAGSARAPITAIIMTAEMIGDYQFIIPLMFAVSTAFIISRIFYKDDIFTTKLKRRGIKFTDEYDVFDDINVQEIMISEEDIIKVKEKDRLEKVIRIMEESGHTGFPVTDEDNNLIGIITEHDINSFFNSGKELTEAYVGDICSRNVVSVTAQCPISMALSIMAGRKINRIPIINGDKQLRGWITRSDIFRIYLKNRHLDVQEKLEKELFENPFVLQMLNNPKTKESTE